VKPQTCLVTRDDVDAAAGRIGHRVRVTPVVDLEPNAVGVEVALTLKLELLQHTGSFKPRGAFNKVLTTGAPAAGLVAASGRSGRTDKRRLPAGPARTGGRGDLRRQHRPCRPRTRGVTPSPNRACRLRTP